MTGPGNNIKLSGSKDERTDMSKPVECFDMHCKLVLEKDKAVLLHWLDEENDEDQEFWVPK